MSYLILIILGFIAGTVGSLIGLGEELSSCLAMLYLSTMTPFFHDVTPQTAIGTSLLVIIFTGLSSTLAYMKYKTVDYKSGLIFLSVPAREASSARICLNFLMRIRFPSGSDFL